MFYENETWRKRNTDTTFDVTMVSYDGSEHGELIGIYMQSLLPNILSKDVFLYKENGLFILRKINKQ